MQPFFARVATIRTAAFAAAALLACGLAASPVEAGWHHRHGCGSCGQHGCHLRHHGSHGSHGCHGSSGGSHGSAGGAPAKAAAAPAAAPKTADLVPADAAKLVVELPANATLVINGQAMTAVGDVRTFAGNGLSAEQKYEYQLTVAIDGPDGREEHRRTVWLTTGKAETVSFHAAFAETARKRAAAVAAASPKEAPGEASTEPPARDLTAR